MIRILHTGAGISFQDQGRVGKHSWLEYGLAPAGSIDPHSANSANALVHNLPSDTVIEILLGGQSLEILKPCWLSHVGGSVCKKLPSGSARFFEKREMLHFQPSNQGVWSYLAIAGGWQASTIFGSSARHERSDLGDSISSQDILKSHVDQIPPSPQCGSRTLPASQSRDLTRPPALRLYQGPHSHLFSPLQRQQLISQDWAISARSDRSGYRLSPTRPHTLQHTHSIHSTPTLVGSVQIPPTGEPIITLNDGPTVGGYPIIARLHPDDLSWLVQRQPFQTIQFCDA